MFVGHLYVFGEMSRSSTQFFNGLLVFFIRLKNGAVGLCRWDTVKDPGMGGSPWVTGPKLTRQHPQRQRRRETCPHTWTGRRAI